MTRVLKVGYVEVNEDWSAPADRRRFIGYARARGLHVESASPEKSYDLVVLSQRADLTVWREYDRAPLVYECIDSYILPPRDFRGRVRGLGKFLTRQHRRLEWRYDKSVAAMCRRADAVVCSTDVLRDAAAQYCDNVHVILDLFDDAVLSVKQDFRAGQPFALVWEGLASGAVGSVLPYVRDVVRPLLEDGTARLHLISDITYPSISDQFGRRHLANDIRRMFGPLTSQVSLYQWNDRTFSAIATACDLAIVPIPPGDPYLRGKPENKLVLLWRTGLPVVTSATPAYSQAMQNSGVPLLCDTLPEWHAMLRRLAHDQALRREAAAAGRRLAEAHYSSAEMLRRWDNVIDSVLK